MRALLGLLPVLGLALIPATVKADRLFEMPTARKVVKGLARYEISFGRDAGRATSHRLAYGIDTSIDIEIRSATPFDSNPDATFAIGYQFVAPVPGISPGIAVGVIDALNRTDNGRRLYAAMTFREAYYTVNGEVNGDLTLGVLGGADNALFVSVAMPFSKEVSLLVEHDSKSITAGLEFRLIRNLTLRMSSQEKKGLLSVSWVQKL